MRALLVGLFVSGATACSSGQTWGGDAPASSASSFRLAGFDGPAEPPPLTPTHADENCDQAGFLGFHFSPQRALPKSDTISNVRSDGQGKRSPMDVVTDILDTGAPLDPCDPSIGAWQYAPDQRATFNVLDQPGNYELVVYRGARAVLAWPDGSATIFDFGPPAPWLPKELQPSLKREWSRDKECRTTGSHPHLIVFSDPGDQPKAVESLGRMCTRLARDPKSPKIDAEWCCP
ncbi:MAG: hypothetical protein U0414_02175 [Polyangiaceae bacterium]